MVTNSLYEVGNSMGLKRKRDYEDQSNVPVQSIMLYPEFVLQNKSLRGEEIELNIGISEIDKTHLNLKFYPCTNEKIMIVKNLKLQSQEYEDLQNYLPLLGADDFYHCEREVMNLFLC